MSKPLYRIHEWSWYSHSFASMMIPAAFTAGLKAWLGMGAALSVGIYAAVALCCAVLFWLKERSDTRRYRATGDYDARQGRDVTGRLDRAGDLVGPFTCAGTALCCAAALGPWWAMVFPVLLGVAFMFYETGRAQELK